MDGTGPENAWAFYSQSERNLKPYIHFSCVGFATTPRKASETSNPRSTFTQKRTATVAFREFRANAGFVSVTLIL
jgi:hypothetical protein